MGAACRRRDRAGCRPLQIGKPRLWTSSLRGRFWIGWIRLQRSSSDRHFLGIVRRPHLLLEAEASTRQPAGKRETTMAVAKEKVTAMATGNAPPPPSRDLVNAHLGPRD